MDITFGEIAAYFLRLIADYWVFFLLVVIYFALPAPYLAFKMMRRNRCEGRDIYRELAWIDRFMDVWIAERPLLSNEQQYFRAFVTNGNSAAAHNKKIDEQLAGHHLIEMETNREGTTYSKGKRGKYLLRNWLIFLLVLFVRVTFFGDKMSHIASGNGRMDKKSLERMYVLTTLGLMLLSVLMITAFAVYI